MKKAAKKAELPSHAERQASIAENLGAYSGLNLAFIRKQVEHLLSLIGREGIFDEYTIHNISHIDKMLASLDWMIPDATKEVMSPSEWLMTTLAIYFHDMGMLVTRREYEDRYNTDFPRYRDEVLFGGPDGADYRSKVEAIGTDYAERFLYQEWVRYSHAERIKAWITGQQKTELGNANEALAEIANLLKPLGEQFRRDLGLICESHHLDDLNDLKKYKPSHPYGDSDAETVNLQYCAVLLRTADLLHITADRTPTTVFKVINPTDPVSQQEWAKQMAVTRVRPKMGLNEDGIPDPSVPMDTIEVFAYFKDDNGFFGLTSYLVYATEQLKRSHEWVSNVKKRNLAKHEFPWRKIDDTNIETRGFIRDSFEFTIDQAKILDLLTGHTLYNDSRIVLRELVQNALDAIKLQCYPNDPKGTGRVYIHWDSSRRCLTVRDNGTGMTQHDISTFLLRVGTSRYQDPDFKKKYPDFSSISRFGIGVLSTFMIADRVEIVTCHPEEEEARRLTLRQVHGKYLIRLLDKNDQSVRKIYPHGSEFSLRIRPSVDMPNIVDVARLWVVVPNCEVTVQVDDESPIQVGHESAAHALQALLVDHGIDAQIASDNQAPDTSDGARVVRVLHARKEGVDVAYSVEWVEFFQEWAFQPIGRIVQVDDNIPNLGTCIEGIRVENQAPGFDGYQLLAIANVTGSGAPKTNVARSGLEATAERDRMLRSIYTIYAEHVAREIEELRSNRAFSLTWALEEARYLMRPLFSPDPMHRGYRPTSSALLYESLSKLVTLPIEEDGRRKAISPAALQQYPSFWTIESAMLGSAERLVREAGAEASLVKIVASLDMPGFAFPVEPVVCGIRPGDSIGSFVYRSREVDRIDVHHGQRRVDLRWVEKSDAPRWISLPDEVVEDQERRLRYEYRTPDRFMVARPLQVGIGGIEFTSERGEVAVKAFGTFFVNHESRVAQYLRRWLERIQGDASREVVVPVLFVHNFIAHCLELQRPISDPEAYVKQMFRRAEAEGHSDILEEAVDLAELTDLVGTQRWRTFDAYAWERRKEEMI